MTEQADSTPTAGGQGGPTGPTTVIHLMRHGEVNNPAGVLYGRLPGYHLTDLGHEMARTVAQALVDGGHDIVGVVTSPLERAIESGAPTAQAFELPARTDERLIEAGNHFEGVPVNRNRWVLARPEHWRYYVNPLRPSWGEPFDEQVARMVAAVRDARAAFEGHEALLVSHQSPIWELRRFLEGKPLWHDPRARECSLASLTSLVFTGTTLTSLAYWEPAGALLHRAEDMVPGTSAAAAKLGDAGAMDDAVARPGTGGAVGTGRGQGSAAERQGGQAEDARAAGQADAPVDGDASGDAGASESGAGGAA